MAVRTRALGPKFSEGSRQLWLLLAKKQWSQAEASRQLSLAPGQLSRLLYGERGPGRELATRLSGGHAKIKIPLWDQAPIEAFTPPTIDGEHEKADVEPPPPSSGPKPARAGRTRTPGTPVPVVRAPHGTRRSPKAMAPAA